MKRALVNVGAWLVAAALGLLTWYPAHANDINVSWTPPTTYTDGSVLTGNIKGYNMEVGTCSADNVFGTRLAVMYPGAARVSYKSGGWGLGKFCVRIRTVDLARAKSEWSGVAMIEFTSNAVIPSPPSGIGISGVLR